LFPFGIAGSLGCEDTLFGSVILEVFLGLVLFYAWFSLACSALTEFLENIRAQRGKQLAIAVAGMLGEQLRNQFYQHGLIRSFSKGKRLPSYVTARSFVLVTFELLGIDSTNYRERIFLVQGSLGETLRTLLRTADSYEALLVAIERWFEATMERCAGWFRRRTRWASFLTSLVMAVALNVDSLEIANSLYSDNLLRMTVVTRAEQVGNASNALRAGEIPSLATSVRGSIGLPIGWENSRIVAKRDSLPSGLAFFIGPVLSKVFGLLATALAGSLGAAFWFDTLKRIIALRTRLARGTQERFDELPTQSRSTNADAARSPVVLPLGVSGPRTVSGLETHSAGIAVYPIVGVGPSA
jgi:hypothetical protein